MAKSTKATGYLVLSIIPIIGIIWAGVSGITHNQKVKNARQFEEKFEAKLQETFNSEDFKTKISSSLNEGVTYPTFDKLNLTKATFTYFEVKLPGDETNNTNSAIITLGANPTIDADGKISKYDMSIEFFVTGEEHAEISNYYNNVAFISEAANDYLYETYYKNNPSKSPAYFIEKIFYSKLNNNKLYVYNFQYKDQLLCGLNITTFKERIEELDSEEFLAKPYSERENEVNLLKIIYKSYSAEQKQEITNYEKLKVAIDDKLPAWKVVDVIDKLPASDAKLEEIYKADYSITSARTAYKALTEKQQTHVTNFDKLVKLEGLAPIANVNNYASKVETAKTNNNEEDFKKYMLLLQRKYSELTDIQKVNLKTEFTDLHNKVVAFAEEYNTKYPANKLEFKFPE